MYVQTVLTKIRHKDFHKTLVHQSANSGSSVVKSNCCGVRCEKKMRYKNQINMAAYVDLIVVSSQISIHCGQFHSQEYILITNSLCAGMLGLFWDILGLF